MMKKHKIMFKGVTCFLIVGVFAFFTILNVDAADNKNNNDWENTQSYITKIFNKNNVKYNNKNVTISVQKGKFKIGSISHIDDNNKVINPPAISFINSINGKSVNASNLSTVLNSISIAPGSDLTISTNVPADIADGPQTLQVELILNENLELQDDNKTKNTLKANNFKFDVTFEIDSNEFNPIGTFDDSEAMAKLKSQIEELKKGFTQSSTNNTYSGFFDAAFLNEAKKNTFSVDKNGKIVYKGTNQNIGLKCDANFKDKSTNINGNYNYANSNKFYATSTETMTKKYSTNKTISCERKCEEVVLVEYGPPIASKAGLCFEYKVKVTSKVRCTSTPNAPDPVKQKYCTPIARCPRSVAAIKNSGGPNEDFDLCINQCDGGKYSQKCSNKCYKKVYGSSDKNLKLNYNDNNVSAQNISVSYSGKYIRESDGTIVWKPSPEGTNTYGRYYEKRYKNVTENTDGTTDGKYSPDSLGFRRRWENGKLCSVYCYWDGSDCGKDMKLNPEEVQKDYNEDLKTQVTLLNECKAAASCTTKTAEFTMSVDYHTKEKKVTINYPDNGSNKLKSQDQKNQTNTDGKKGVVIDYAGCYTTNDAKDHYMTEITFPGTWLTTKSGVKVEYKKPEGSSVYAEKQFCIHQDALSVNTKWWEWNQLDNCMKTVDPKTLVNEYNIHATAKNFGYFGWNFNVDCFYAIRNETCDELKDGCCASEVADCYQNTNKNAECGKIVENNDDYDFRVVDTTNLFNNREPGYNWSDDAKNFKNPKYIVNPEALRNQIANSNTYSNDNLDYEVTLTKNSIKNIRDYNKGKKYTDFKGKITADTGVAAYQINSEVLNGVKFNKRGNSGKNNEKMINND